MALGFWEVYRPLKHPILPPKLFRRNRQFAVIIAVVFLNGMLYYSSNILWPRQAALFFAPKDDAVTSGLYTNIFNFGTCVSSAIVLGVVPHVGKERWQMVTLLAVQTALIGSMATVGTEDKAQAIVTVLLISSTISPVSFLAFGMSSLALEDQNDLYVFHRKCSSLCPLMLTSVQRCVPRGLGHGATDWRRHCHGHIHCCAAKQVP